MYFAHYGLYLISICRFHVLQLSFFGEHCARLCNISPYMLNKRFVPTVKIFQNFYSNFTMVILYGHFHNAITMVATTADALINVFC